MARRSLPDASVRTMHLVALDATSLLRRLEERHLEMLSAFSRLRDREGLLATMRCFGLSARFEDLAVVGPEVQDAVTRFYDLVDDLRWYFQFTTDMPGTLAQKFADHRRRLAEAHGELTRALEAASEAPVRKPRAKAAARRKRG